MDRMVGAVWRLIIITGFGNDRLGLAVIIGALALLTTQSYGFDLFSYIRLLLYNTKGRLD